MGDVLGVAAPDGHTTHLVISPAGFTTITPPTDRIHLAATSASSRRAFPWQPADLTATVHLLAYLAAHGTDFDHPSGHGAATTLRLHTPTGPLTVQPGNWLVHADSGHWQTVTAHTFANG